MTISEELLTLYTEDQQDRRELPSEPSYEAWKVVEDRDAKRLARVLEVLNADLLHSAADYYHAAMIFQHGGEPEMYLRAHVLSCLAGFEGDERGRWLAAAALDRFLQSIDRAQVFGTQHKVLPGEPPTQEPYDRSLPDAIRKAYNVPRKGSE